MGKLLCEKNLRDVWCRNEIVRAEIGQIVHTHTHTHASPIGLYRENAIAVRVIDRSAYDATSHVHAHRQRKNLSYLRNGCCIYYLRPSGAAHL